MTDSAPSEAGTPGTVTDFAHTELETKPAASMIENAETLGIFAITWCEPGKAHWKFEMS